MYNGKVQLIVTLQWNNGNEEAVIANKEYETFDEAFAELKKTIPTDAYIDDGDDREDWETELCEGREPFIQYCYYLNDNCYWLGAIYYAK